MKKFFTFVLLAAFLMGGFLFGKKALASNYTSTLPPECPTQYNPYDNPTNNEMFWYDGKYFRFSFDATQTFCIGWGWKSYPILIGSILNPLSIQITDGSNEMTYSFINNMNDLDRFTPLEKRYIKLESGQRYDTYLADSSTISPGGYLNTTDILRGLIFSGWTEDDFTAHVKISTFNYDSKFHSKINLKNFTFNFNNQPETTTSNPLIIIPGILGSWKLDDHWKIDPIFHSYDNLLEALISAGYKEPFASTEPGNLFTFPYDWRQSNTTTAELLKEKIAEVKKATGKNKVDIVAHSMGGLVARQYIESDDYQNDVGKMIFVGTPHLGSPMDYLITEGGKFSGPLAYVFESLFQLEATENMYSNLTRYIHDKVPSSAQLLPIYNYLKVKQPDGTWTFKNYPDKYPENTFLTTLNQPTALEKLKQRVEVTNIYGNTRPTSTICSFRVVNNPNTNSNNWYFGYPENFDSNQSGTEYCPGDDTVPYSSANSLTGVATIETTDKTHQYLPNLMQKEIIETLTGKRPKDFFDNNWITADAKRFIFFRVYSPVDFNITAPDGKRIGKDFATGQSVNEIPGAFYTGFNTNEEFVLIPDPMNGEYKANIQGVDGGGDYTFAGSVIDQNTQTRTSEVKISSTLLAGGQDTLSINTSATSTLIESDIDFQKMIALTNSLYDVKEIKKESAHKNLVKEFERLDKKYDKIINSKKHTERALRRLEIIIETKVVAQIIRLGEHDRIMTAKARDILLINLDLLTDKLK